MNLLTASYPDLAGHVTLVTGGASGIGLAVAEAFAEQGCHLILLDINEASLSKAAKQIQRHGTDVFTVIGSVTEQEPIRHACAEAVQTVGPHRIQRGNCPTSYLSGIERFLSHYEPGNSRGRRMDGVRLRLIVSDRGPSIPSRPRYLRIVGIATQVLRATSRKAKFKARF